MRFLLEIRSAASKGIRNDIWTGRMSVTDQCARL